MIPLIKNADDDPEFLRTLQNLLAGALRTLRVETTTVLRIDNWFDRKWLGFSGKGVVSQGLLLSDVETVALWSDSLTLPPFTRKRVKDKSSYRWCGFNECFIRDRDGPRWEMRKRSSRNLHLRMESVASDGLFVWYSANTAENGRGCVMFYLVKAEETVAAYVSMSRSREWVPEASEGVALDTVRRYTGLGAELRAARRNRVPSEEEALTKRLCEAIEAGALVQVVESIGADVDLEGRNKRGLTPLLVALEEVEWEIARYLIKAGANPFQACLFGDGALHYCVTDGGSDDECIGMMHAFAELGVSLESRNQYGSTPLLLAVECGDRAAVTSLLALGADVHATDFLKMTPLLRAACLGHVEILEQLLDGGARVRDRGRARLSALICAALVGSLECVKVLHDAGASLHTEDKDGWTALKLARHKGHASVVEYIEGQSQDPAGA